MGLFDKIKENRYKKLDRDYQEGWNRFLYLPNLVDVDMNCKTRFTEQDRKDAEQCFKEYLKLKETPSTTAKEYNLLFAASKGHEEANRLVRKEFFLDKYQSNYRSYHVAYWTHLYICKEYFGFKWAEEEFNEELVKDLVRVEGLSKNPRKFEKKECAIPEARQRELAANVSNEKFALAYRGNALIEGLKGGFYFPGCEQACRVVASATQAGFDAIYFFLDDLKELTSYLYKRVGQKLEKDQVELVEYLARVNYAKTGKTSDGRILGKVLLLLDPTPANILEGLSLLRYAAKKGDKDASDFLAYNTNVVPRTEALEILKEKARRNHYSSQEDLIDVYNIVKESGLYREGAEFVYEFFTMGGHDKNIQGFIKTNYALVNFLKEIDMNGLGYLQFDYACEKRAVPQTKVKSKVEAEQYYDLFYAGIQKLDLLQHGYSPEAAILFQKVAKSMTKKPMIVDRDGGSIYVEFPFELVASNEQLCALADLSDAFPALLSKAYENELGTIRWAKERYQRVVGTKEDPGSYEAFLKAKGLEWVNDPIKGFKPKCAQQFIVDAMEIVKKQLLEKCVVVYKGLPCRHTGTLTTPPQKHR